MVRRNVWERCVRYLDRKEIVLILGARQVGKTTLLRALKEQAESQGLPAHYLTLEDPDLLSALEETPENMFRFIRRPRDRTVLLIDEIQYLSAPSRFLKYLYDTYAETLKIVASGSSAFFIDRSFRDSLAGRKRIIDLFPFSFQEFLRANEETELEAIFSTEDYQKSTTKRSILVPQRRKLEPYLVEYLRFGGYPAVILEKDEEEKILTLEDLHRSFLKKDILEAGVQKEHAFYKTVSIIADESGGVMNASGMAGSIGVAPDTVRSYLHLLQKSYIVSAVPPFHRNIRKELTKMPKVYFLDSGFRNAVLNDFRAPQERLDRGAILENAVHSALRSGEDNGRTEEIRFWRTQDGREVDFVVGERIAFEAKWDPSRFRANKYRSFQEAYPEIRLAPVGWSNEEFLDLFDLF
jgi:uncharacterized protein